MMKRDNSRGAFTSSFGVMMAVAGSAVGLGNIWRFPYLAGMNGGAAFLILYLVLVVLVGLPLILAEFCIGRASGRGCVDSFKVLSPKTKWYRLGYLSVVAGFTILGFYSVIGGWTIRFLGHAITGFDPTTVVSDFHIFVNSGWWPLLFSASFIAITMAIVARGVEKGIEQSSKILMPLLLIILVALCVNSMTLSGFTQGMSFLFEPDFSKITTQTVLDAVGQVFFTLSIGMGVMITYSSYVHKQENMLRSKIKVTIIDTLVAIISGVAIFPAVFTYGLSPSEGPSLVFLALPSVFAQMPFGNFIGVLFFALLFIAAITSAVSIFEMLTAVFMEKYRLTRTRALFTIGGGVFLLSVLSALSQVEGSALRLFGINFFDFLDMLSSNYLLTLGGLLTAIFTGWFFGRRALRAVFTSDGRYSVRFFPVFLFIIKYVSPIAVAAVFLSKLGLI